MVWAYGRKMARYSDLKSQSDDRGWLFYVYPVEVGCHGFVDRSVIRHIGFAPKAEKYVIRCLQGSAESASASIWNTCERSI